MSSWCPRALGCSLPGEPGLGRSNVMCAPGWGSHTPVTVVPWGPGAPPPGAEYLGEVLSYI